MFIDFTIMDFIDIFLVAMLLFYFYKLMKDTGTLNVFGGIIIFFISWIVVAKILHMRLLGSIMDQLMSVGAIALIVIFHEEVRSFFKRLGSKRRFKFLSFFGSRAGKTDDKHESIMVIVMSCISMAQQKTGALIVIERNDPLNEIVTTGEVINAKLGQRLMEAIFFTNAPLHDGAIVIRNDTIVAAQCILPVSQNLDIPKRLGLRHRAAMGLSESTDALAIIVSEETGSISVALNGKFMLNLDARRLEDTLVKELCGEKMKKSEPGTAEAKA